MRYRSNVLAVIYCLFCLTSCDDPIPQDQDWIVADGFPCNDTGSLTDLLAEEPHRDSPFAHLVARDACGRIGKVFSGKAQCVDQKIQVKCETSSEGWVDLPHLCETTSELFATAWKLDAAETRCSRIGKTFTGDTVCVNRGMQAECDDF